MRKKKYLNERLDAVSDILFKIDTDDRNFNTAILEKDYIDLKAWFGNDNPIYLEIGCGKGGFAAEFAKRNPDINLIALEKSANVIVGACEIAKNENIPNLRFICGSAEYIEKYIPDSCIERLFLNFSCPFPKNAYAVHRLTHRRFLKIYKNLMKRRDFLIIRCCFHLFLRSPSTLHRSFGYIIFYILSRILYRFIFDTTCRFKHTYRKFRNIFF
jgi:tRNA (guanine-N7-)-methyltransferase